MRMFFDDEGLALVQPLIVTSLPCKSRSHREAGLKMALASAPPPAIIINHDEGGEVSKYAQRERA